MLISIYRWGVAPQKRLELSCKQEVNRQVRVEQFLKCTKVVLSRDSKKESINGAQRVEEIDRRLSPNVDRVRVRFPESRDIYGFCLICLILFTIGIV